MQSQLKSHNQKNPDKSPSLLIVDDDVNFALSLERALGDDYRVSIACSAEEAQKLFWNSDIVLVDVRLKDEPANWDGLDLLARLLAEKPLLPIIMITAYSDINIAVEAMKKGAADFLLKPLDLIKLRATLESALQKIQLQRQVISLKRDFKRIEPLELVGQDLKILEIRDLINHVAKDGFINVLISGETGTGKELIARLIHHNGWRAEGAYVAISLAALAPTLIESELLGHERGAFTDAKERKIGYIEQAHKGVLFLDDVDAAPPEIQVKLLRFLEERSFSRLGNSRPIESNVQVLSASNQNMSELIRSGRLREDFYYRINTMEIRIPPLRNRLEDIPLLANHFLGSFREQGRSSIDRFAVEALDAMRRHSWPGNVRELRNCVEKAILSAGLRRHSRIEIDDLPVDIREPREETPQSKSLNPCPANFVDLENQKAIFELGCIEAALKETKGRKTEAWKLLKLNDRFALRRKILNLHRNYPELFREFLWIQKAFPKIISK